MWCRCVGAFWACPGRTADPDRLVLRRLQPALRSQAQAIPTPNASRLSLFRQVTLIHPRSPRNGRNNRSTCPCIRRTYTSPTHCSTYSCDVSVLSCCIGVIDSFVIAAPGFLRKCESQAEKGAEDSGKDKCIQTSCDSLACMRCC